MDQDRDPAFFEVVRRQRACRAFRPDPVADEVVAAVLEAATFAPSAENSQPWVFVVVTEPEARSAIGELMRRAWDDGARRFEESRLDERLLADVDRGARGGVAGAPVLVVVAADRAAVPAAALASSIFPAVQNLLLAATATGLGSALTTLATGPAAELRALTGLPDGLVPVAVIPLGHPEQPLAPPRRHPFTTVAHRERYGRPWQGARPEMR